MHESPISAGQRVRQGELHSEHRPKGASIECGTHNTAGERGQTLPGVH